MYIEINETLETSFSVKGSTNSNGKDLVNHTATKGYRAVVRKAPSFETVQFSQVTEAHIARDPRLPIVNRSTWYSQRTGLSMPFAVCRSKDVTRDSKNGNVFYITCNFETGPVEEEQRNETPPSKPEDLSPQVSIEIGSYDRVLHEDKTGKQCWRLPTGSPFQTPVVETAPTLRLTITQFEPFVTYEEILERSFKTNRHTYRNKDRGRWLIGAVKVTEQDVTLANNSVATWAKVTYPIMLSERYYYPVGYEAIEENRIFYGHEHIQPLVDTYKLDVAGGKPEPIVKGGNVTTGYIYDDGTERIPDPAQPDDNRPQYLRFRTQDEIDFDLFLQA